MPTQNSILSKYSKSAKNKSAKTDKNLKIKEIFETYFNSSDSFDMFLCSVGMIKLFEEQRVFLESPSSGFNKKCIASLIAIQKDIGELHLELEGDSESRILANDMFKFFYPVINFFRKNQWITSNIDTDDVDEYLSMVLSNFKENAEYTYSFDDEFVLYCVYMSYGFLTLYDFDVIVLKSFCVPCMYLIYYSEIDSEIDIPGKNKLLSFYVDILNSNLDLDIELDINDVELMSKEEKDEFVELYGKAITTRIKKDDCIVIIEEDSAEDIWNKFYTFHTDPTTRREKIELTGHKPAQTAPKADSKAFSAILNFFDSNSNTLIAKLKDSGLQLSAAALQNDQNITRVANVVYNLLPGMVRIFVSFDTVENFLLENRQWLINKLV